MPDTGNADQQGRAPGEQPWETFVMCDGTGYRDTLPEEEDDSPRSDGTGHYNAADDAMDIALAYLLNSMSIDIPNN